jgi:cytidylate kinase
MLQVIERQFRRWELQRKAREAERAPVHWPIITISREFGARGEALGRLVAEAAGFSFWDDELVHTIAQESGANTALLKSLDEHLRNSVEDSIEGAFLGGEYMESEYLRRLMKLIHTIAAHGGGVVVGRGAHYVVARDQALSVRVVCPLEERVRGYAERQGIDERRARQTVEREDQARRAFIRERFSRDPSTPSDYDVTVNTGTLPLERTAPVVLAAYEAKFGRRPSPKSVGGASQAEMEISR